MKLFYIFIFLIYFQSEISPLQIKKTKSVLKTVDKRAVGGLLKLAKVTGDIVKSGLGYAIGTGFGTGFQIVLDEKKMSENFHHEKMKLKFNFFRLMETKYSSSDIKVYDQILHSYFKKHKYYQLTLHMVLTDYIVMRFKLLNDMDFLDRFKLNDDSIKDIHYNIFNYLKISKIFIVGMFDKLLFANNIYVQNKHEMEVYKKEIMEYKSKAENIYSIFHQIVWRTYQYIVSIDLLNKYDKVGFITKQKHVSKVEYLFPIIEEYFKNNGNIEQSELFSTDFEKDLYEVNKNFNKTDNNTVRIENSDFYQIRGICSFINYTHQRFSTLQNIFWNFIDYIKEHDNTILERIKTTTAITTTNIPIQEYRRKRIEYYQKKYNISLPTTISDDIISNENFSRNLTDEINFKINKYKLLLKKGLTSLILYYVILIIISTILIVIIIYWWKIFTYPCMILYKRLRKYPRNRREDDSGDSFEMEMFNNLRNTQTIPSNSENNYQIPFPLIIPRTDISHDYDDICQFSIRDPPPEYQSIVNEYDIPKNIPIRRFNGGKVVETEIW